MALSNTIAREIIHAGLVNTVFIERGTAGFAEYRGSGRRVDARARLTRHRGTSGGDPRARPCLRGADRAQICWTLGITEHHNGVDNVLALINLSLLCGHVGRWGAGLNPFRGQNNVQGGGDMGALPTKLPGFQDVEDTVARAKFEAKWGTTIPPENGWHLTEMFEAMYSPRAQGIVRDRREPGPVGGRRPSLDRVARGLDHLVVQDIFLTKTAELADVVLPGSASWCEANGTVTNSERRVQLVRKALDPPGDARDDIEILLAVAANLGHEWTYGSAEEIWDELRSLSPMHAGMSYARLAELGGIQWPCYSEDRLEPSFLHGRLWADDPADRGRLAPFSVVVDDPPVDLLDDEFPLRLTTGRRLDSYNTGVQSGGFQSPLRFGETIDISPEDAERLDLHDGETVRVVSRRGAVEAPVARRRHAPTGSGVHDVPFPRRDPDQLVDDRRHRPEVGNRRIQGGRSADRQDRRPRARRGRLNFDELVGVGRMDLKVASAAATDVERAAVDALLGPAPAAAQGGARDAADHFLAHGGAALPRVASSPLAHAARGERPRRMDQPRRDQLHR